LSPFVLENASSGGSLLVLAAVLAGRRERERYIKENYILG
jgi:hypothetical protein